ncbi:MAG: hypothetical protein K8S87_05235 [Planctomycetes bacterium]|nr:hypothetical protein [Planctomycetota bacterium]
MDSQRELIIEYIRGELEGDEKQSFERLLNIDAKFKKEYEKQKNIWDLYGKLPQIKLTDSVRERTLHSVKHYKSKSIKIRMFHAQDKIEIERKKVARRLFTPISAAAAVLILTTVIITMIVTDSTLSKMKEGRIAASEKSEMKEKLPVSVKNGDLKTIAPEESEKMEMDSKGESLKKAAPQNGWDNTKLKNNSEPEIIDDEETNENYRVLWPDKPLSRKSKGYDSIASDNRGGGFEREDKAPEISADASKDSIERKKEMNDAIASDIYVYFLDRGAEMDISLSENQKLNMPTELKDKISTRFDMAKHEIIHELKALGRNDRFLVIILEGLGAYRISKIGNRTEFTSFNISFILNNNNEVVNSITKELEKLSTKNYNYKSDDKLEVIKDRIQTISSIISHLKFYTAMVPENTVSADSVDAKPGKGYISSNVDIIDLGGSSNLEGWAKNNNFSYSRR